MTPTPEQVAHLRKTLEYVTNHPEEYDQHFWIKRVSTESWCGTTRCVAGTAAMLAGYAPEFQDEHLQTASVRDPASGVVRDVMYVAAELFGLPVVKEGDFSPRQPDYDLFRSSTSLAELWHIAHAFTEGAIEVPLELQNHDYPDGS